MEIIIRFTEKSFKEKIKHKGLFEKMSVEMKQVYFHFHLY